MPPRICVDASVAIKWYVPTEPHRGKALQLRYDSRKMGRFMISPPLFAMEIDSIVQSRLVAGLATVALSDRVLAEIDRSRVVISNHQRLRQRAREIARQLAQEKVYDATYAALAELSGCDFWTADQNFYSQARHAFPFVKYLPNYP